MRHDSAAFEVVRLVPEASDELVEDAVGTVVADVAREGENAKLHQARFSWRIQSAD